MNGVQIQVKDKYQSKSFTIHGLSLDTLYHELFYYVRKLRQYDDIQLICYKKGLTKKGEVNNDKKKTRK